MFHLFALVYSESLSLSLYSELSPIDLTGLLWVSGHVIVAIVIYDTYVWCVVDAVMD